MEARLDPGSLGRSKPFRSRGEAVLVHLTTAAVGVGMMIEGLLRAHGLTGTQYNVLRILRGAPPEGYARGDIIDRLMVPNPDATRLIDRLARRRLVARRKSPRDGRITLHTITAAGRAAIEALDPTLEDVHRRVVKCLGRDESDALVETCGRLIRATRAGQLRPAQGETT